MRRRFCGFLSRSSETLWRLSRQFPRLLLLLFLLTASFKDILKAVVASPNASAPPEIPRGPAPHTMQKHEASFPHLQEKTLFIIDNEPVIESHIASNLLHQLLFSADVPQQHIRMRDEAFFFADRQARLAATSLGRWLAAEAEQMPAETEFVFLCSAYTRIDPKTLEFLLEQLSKLSPLNPFILGWGLLDERPAITHHFAAAKSLVFPALDAGTLWSRAAFVSLAKAMKETPPAAAVERDFVYELFIHLKKTQQLQLLHSELFCPLPPVFHNYERANAAYPPPHVRPKKPAGAEAADAANKNRQLTHAETVAAAAAESTAARHKGCVAFSSGTRHAPVLSHQLFDGLIDFDEELLLKREHLEEQFSPQEKEIGGGEYQKAVEKLENERPAFIVEPQDLMVAVKTHAKNHATRLPLLRRLWASPEALLNQARRHSGDKYQPNEQISKEQQRQLKESYAALSLRFFSDTPDAQRGIEAPAVQTPPGVVVPRGKAGLCLRLQQIFREFLLTPELRRFLLVVDDDTLLNFRHLMDLASLTLQPAIPARNFLANLLADERGFRAYSPKYKLLASQTRMHLKKLAAAAGVPEGAAVAAKQQLAESPRYTAEELTGASAVYGRHPSASFECLSPLYLGERYGYALTGAHGQQQQQQQQQQQGYAYATMGAGVLLDREAVRLLVACADAGQCRCPPDGTADDMLLGMWAKQLNIPLTHARGMHQEKPEEYHPLLVETLTPVSFHRMQQTAKATQSLFAEFVDIEEGSSDGSRGQPLSAEDLIEVDWIDFDWHHAEDQLWTEREELHELAEDEPLLPKGIGSILSSKVARGTRPMTPEELLDHELDEPVNLHDEL